MEKFPKKLLFLKKLGGGVIYTMFIYVPKFLRYIHAYMCLIFCIYVMLCFFGGLWAFLKRKKTG
ncbi:hypothetical protein A9D69_01125 [Mycoplasmopsis bovis]|nr:hypothetical protein A9D69_01125 [Mycoplasmopsis bovis]TQF50864.1 hypothetical protein A9307_01000 [Mycoplasmopsis bovis]